MLAKYSFILIGIISLGYALRLKPRMKSPHDSDDGFPVCRAEVAERIGVSEDSVQDSVLSGGFSKLYNVRIGDNAVIVKVLPREADEFVNELFDREQLFYLYARRANFKRIPYIHHMSKGVIAMEDLHASGYTTCTAQKLLNADEMALILSGLAEFHALPLTGFPAAKFPPRHEWEGFGEGVAPMVAAGLERLKSEDIVTSDVVDRLEEAGIVEILTSPFKGPMVLSHGDCWMENWLMNPEKGTVRTIDFQFVGQGLAADDLVLLLFTGMDSATRKKSWDRLLHVYASYYNVLETSDEASPTKFSDMFTPESLRHGAALTALVLLADLDHFPREHVAAILDDISLMLLP